MQLVLLGAEVLIGDADGLVDQSQRAADVSAMQLDQGASVRHEGREEGELLRRRALREGQRGVDPRQGQVLIQPGRVQVPGVDHRHHVGVVHLLGDLGGDAPVLVDHLDGLVAARQVGQRPDDALGQVVVHPGIGGVGQQRPAAAAQVQRRLVEALPERLVLPGDEPGHRLRRVLAALQVIRDRAQLRAGLGLVGEQPGPAAVPRPAFLRGRRLVGPQLRRVRAGAVGVDVALDQVPRRAARGERGGAGVDDDDAGRDAAARQHREELGIGRVRRGQLPEPQRDALRVAGPGPRQHQLRDHVREVARALDRVEAGPLIPLGQVGQGLRADRDRALQVGSDRDHRRRGRLDQARVDGQELGDDVPQQLAPGGVRAAEPAVAAQVAGMARSRPRRDRLGVQRGHDGFLSGCRAARRRRRSRMVT